MGIIKLNRKPFFNMIKDNIHILILIAICFISFFLNFYNISNYGYGNEYYAAAVKSMTQSLKNFFFVSFDPSGMVSIDKPPLGLWIQCLFTLLLGYNGYSIMLPQALCGVGSCIIIYLILSTNRNKITGLISAFIFSITPSIVVISRNNTMDMQLIFILLLSTLYLFKYLTSNKLKHLIICAICIGLGFNIKMLQAYTILPAIFFTYFIFSKNRISLKISRAVIAFILMIIVSFSWMFAVDLYPSNSRPYIDNSKNNSMIELAINYNGIDRLLGMKTSSSFSSNSNTSLSNSKNSGDYIGTPSISRLWSESLYGQISWLLVLAIGSLILGIKQYKNENLRLKKADFIFWSTWMITMFIIFSFSGFFHRYYLSMLAPSIAALSGISISSLIENKKSCHFNLIISTIFILSTIFLQIRYVYNYTEIRGILTSITVLMFIISAAIFISNIKIQDNFNTYVFSIFLICSLSICPLYWSMTTLAYVPNLTMPSAGPELADSVTNVSSVTNDNSKNTSLGLQNYLLKNYKQGSFLVVSKKSIDVSKFIINTGLPVYAYGGFLGTSETLNVDKLKQYVDEGKITYFLISYEDMNNDNSSDLISYVKENGTLIPPSDYDLKYININSSLPAISGLRNNSLYLLKNNLNK